MSAQSEIYVYSCEGAPTLPVNNHGGTWTPIDFCDFAQELTLQLADEASCEVEIWCAKRRSV